MMASGKEDFLRELRRTEGWWRGISGAGSVVCGGAIRMACSTLVCLSHVHVLLDLKGDLREQNEPPRGG